MKNTSIFEKGKTIFLYMVLLMNILTVVIATFYGLPAADDFMNTLSYKTFSGNWFDYMIWNVKSAYEGWQGTYFGVFLCGIHSYYDFGMIGLRLQMLINALLFFFSISLCICAGIEKIGMKREEERYIKLLFITMAIFYVLNMNNLGEIFYWQTGLCVYTIPLSFGFLTIFAYLKYEISEKKWKWLIIGNIFALCGAGGALDISAFLCATLLLGILYNLIIRRTIEANCLIGVSAFVGAVINAIAPGNYVRHEMIDSEIRVGRMVFETIGRVNEILSQNFQSGILLVIIIVCFVSLYKRLQDCDFEFKYPGLVTLYCYIGIILTDFPVALGYSRATDLPGRCRFVECVATIIFVLIATIYWSGWVAKGRRLSFSREHIFLLVLICMIPASGYLRKNDELSEFTIYNMCEHLIKGDYADKAKEQEYIISQIENSTDSDVVVTVNRPSGDAWTNLMPIGLTEDATHWINIGIANYYDKNSIAIQYTDNTDE